MKTITQYKEDIRVLMDKAAEIDTKCISENRDPTSAELIFQNEIMDTVKDYRGIIATMERRERVASELENPDAPETKPAPDNKGNGITIRDKDTFSSLGGMLMAVKNAGVPGGHVDPRLRNIQATAAGGMGETTPSDGGFLVQQDYSTELLQEVIETGILAAKCRRIQISANSNGIKIPGIDETSRVSSRAGGIIAYWKDEAGMKVATKPKFREIDLNLKKLIGLVYTTDELLADVTALESFVKAAFVSEFGFQIDDAIINGTGAGVPLGILNAGCLVSVQKETGQPADTIVAENVMKMRSRLFASSRLNSVWLINQNCEPQLSQMSLAVGTGGSLTYMPAGGLSMNPYDTLYGRPVIPIEQCASVGTVGDIILADFQNGYIIAEKGGIQTDMSIHVQFLYDETAFRFILRIDGQPVRASVLIPYKGTSETQSHFIALQSRD